MQSLNRAAGPYTAPSSSRAHPWAPGPHQQCGPRRRPSPSAAAPADGGDAAAAPADPSTTKPRRLSPGDRRRAQRAAVAARRAERRRTLLTGRGRGNDDDDDETATPATAPPRSTDKPRTSAEARARLAEHVDPAALAALEQLESAVGRLPPLQAAALLTMAQTEMKGRFDKALASVEADGGGQLASLFAAAAAAERAEKGDSDEASTGPQAIERTKNALVADEALDRAIWELCLQRALNAPQRAVLEKIVAGIPLRRAPDALARALAGGLDPENRVEGGEQVTENADDDDGLNVHAFAISRRLELLTEAEGVHLRRAMASLATTLASLREAAFAVGGAEQARREFEASLAGMVADAADDEQEEEGEDDAAAADAAAPPPAAAEPDEEDEEDLDPLQRRLKAYSKYARLLAEGSPQEARALWYTAGGEPSDAFRALKDVVRRIVEVSLVVPQLQKHEEGRAEAAAKAWQEAYERFQAERGGGEEDDEGAAEDAADRAARLAADAFDATNPEGAELSRNAEKLRAARRTLQRRAAAVDGEGDEDDEDDDEDAADEDDEDEASAAAYRQLLAPLTDEEAEAAFVSLSDELAAVLAAIQAQAGGSDPDEAADNTAARPTAAGRWASSRRAAGADARSAALYLAALTDDDGGFDASPSNLARLCTFLRATEALEALKALAIHSQEVRATSSDLAYGTDRGTARARRAARAASDAFSEREKYPFSKSNAPPSSPRSASLKPPTGAEAVRLAGLDRDDWWVPEEKRGKAWAAVRVAELDASFAGKVAANGKGKGSSSKRSGGNGRGFGTLEAGAGGEGGASEAQAAAVAAFAGENPYRALLRFADEGRIRELAALDADDLLFLADMERCGWGDDDCLVKWTLHPRVGPRLRATGPGGEGFGGAGEGRGGEAFFGGLPESLRDLMMEARAAAAAERREEGGGRRS